MFSVALSLSLLFAAVCGQLSGADKQDLLEAHNYFRSSVSPIATNMEMMVTIRLQQNVAIRYRFWFIIMHACSFWQRFYLSQVWNDELATVAQTYAEKCVLAPNNNRTQQSTFTTVGENILIYSDSGNRLNYTRLVDIWYSEGADYNYSTNTCSSNSVCGHYTQVCLT